MKIFYEDLIYCDFIDELERQKVLIEQREDKKVKKSLATEIDKEWARVSDIIKDLEVYEQDMFIFEFQEFVAEKIIDYFNEVSEKFQKTYAIFENQIAKVGKGKLFDFATYPIIEEMNNVVNVLKHGKDGRSYKALQTANSIFLNNPTEFLSLALDIPTNVIMQIIEAKYSGLMLNLEYCDLTKFLDEAVNAWRNILADNAAKRV